MTLQHFQRLVARTDADDLRRAMAVALAVEIPHDPDAYERFYARVAEATTPPDAPPR